MSQISVTPQFKNFITSLLQRADLSNKNIEKYTDEESMMVFRQAFIHPSYDPAFNYEFLEFRGDVVVNLAMTQYLQHRFPNVVAVSWLTKLKHNLVSKNFLSTLSLSGGFFKHILYGKEIEHIVRKDPTKNEMFVSMMEDVFEAFAGALTQVVDSISPRGVGYAISYKIIASFCDTQEISLDWEDVFDAKTRLKELYDVLEWGDLSEFISTRYDKARNKTRAIIKGYPRGKDKPKSDIVHAFGDNDKKAQEEAAENALDILLNRYHFTENIPSAYAENVEIKVSIPDIPPGFREFVEKMLLNAGVKETSVKDFTDEASLAEFRMSLVHLSYDEMVNYNVYKFEGIAVSDLVIAEYIQARFPQYKSEKWLTRLKHTITSKEKRVLADASLREGFADFVVYGEKIEESIEKYGIERNNEYRDMLKAVFMAFVGAMVRVIDSKRRRGVGYAVVYNFYEYCLDMVDIPSDYDDIFDTKSRLQELYLRMGWMKGRYETNFDEKIEKYRSQVFGFPRGNKKPIEENKELLGEGVDTTKTKAEKIAAGEALKKLDRLYRISEVPPDT